MLLLALPATGPVDHGDRDGVHQVVDLLLDAVHGVGGHEEVPLVQVLDRWAILTCALVNISKVYVQRIINLIGREGEYNQLKLNIILMKSTSIIIIPERQTWCQA